MWIIGTEAAQFPEKEYINGIFFAVYTVNKKIIWKYTIEWILCQNIYDSSKPS